MMREHKQRMQEKSSTTNGICCSLEDMARIEIDDISDGNRGTLRISAANSRSSIFIKTCLEPFHDLFPNVVYEIYETDVNEQSQQLLSGITELGILSVAIWLFPKIWCRRSGLARWSRCWCFRPG